MDHIWQLNAVTLAAQVLTTPLSIFHFHQFPVYFLLTNFVAVPLSSVIVIGEILLCAIAFIPSIARILGNLLSWLIMLMNEYVGRIEALPGSLWDGLQIDIVQTILLFILVTSWAYWLIRKIKTGFVIGLMAALAFIAFRSYSFYQAGLQLKIIIYNVPRRQAVDFIEGRNYLFFGDSDLVRDEFTQNFYLKPCRILHRISDTRLITNLAIDNKYAVFGEKKILLLDSGIVLSAQSKLPDIDLVIISRSPKLSIATLANGCRIKQVVFDGSASTRKLPYWKKECDSVHIPYHDVTEKGAFVMKLN